jgi:hopanoid biosynthesis associated protein HpnK
MERERRLVVNADDFGRSQSINAAVIRAHREGILTTASLMVNEAACAEAVQLARENPKLGIGLHLTLLCGHSALASSAIPGLVNARSEFTNSPLLAGCSYFFRRGLKKQLRAEIHEQFARFRASGLALDHVNGHLHMHLHPAIFSVLMEDAEILGIDRLRLTTDPLWLNLRLDSRSLLYKLLHAVIFGVLSRRASRVIERRGIRHTARVFGLLQNARVDEGFLARLLPELPRGDSELYSHPSLDEFRNEFEALISPQIRRLVEHLGIKLIRYSDL